MKISTALDNGYSFLKSNNINSYKIDAELLLSDSLNISRERLILNFDEVIVAENYKNFLLKLNRRKKRNQSLTYLIKKNFGKLNFM